MAAIREIVFDTETTGFDARGDDRITEIGCIEIIGMLPTGAQWLNTPANGAIRESPRGAGAPDRGHSIRFKHIVQQPRDLPGGYAHHPRPQRSTTHADHDRRI